MKVTINRLNRVYRQFTDGRIAYFDISRLNGKLKKPIFWFLQKIGLTPVYGEEYLPADVIELDDIIEQIYANQSVLENVLHREAKYLFVGHDVMKRIGMRYVYGAVQLPMKVQSGNTLLANNIAGLKLIFLPYMTGLVVVPDFDNIVLDNQASFSISDVPSIPDLELL